MFIFKRPKSVRKTVSNAVFGVTGQAKAENSIITHHSYVFIVVFCALFFMNALPHAAYAQEVADQVEVTTAEDSESTEFLGLYTSEGIPGGDAVVGDIVVGPGKIDLELEAGQTKISQMTVTNRTGETRRFKITVEDAVGSTDSDTPIILLGDDEGPYSLRDYIYVPYTTFDLEHNQRALVPITLTLPADAEPGGLYGSVLVETVASKGTPGNTGGTVPTSPIIARVGTVFFVTVPGEIERNMELKQFGTIPERSFYQSSPIDFGILHENTGSIHAAPYGEMHIKNMFGEEVGYIEMEPWFVLPKSIRLREISWDRDALFGKYTATVSINRSYDDIIDEMSYTFWVLPWKPVTIAFVVIFVVLFTIRSFFRKFEFTRKS